MGKKPTDSTTAGTTPKTDTAEPAFDADHNRRGRMAAHVAQGLLSRENIPDDQIPKKVRELTDAILKELDK